MDCFAWNYDEMFGFNKSLVKHELPTQSNYVPHKQPSRSMTNEVVILVKEEI